MTCCARSLTYQRSRGTCSSCATHTRGTAGDVTVVFFFFSNRLGCAGSLLVSALATLVLLLLIGVIHM